MKKAFLFLFWNLLLFAAGFSEASPVVQNTAPKIVNVGIVYDGPWYRATDLEDIVKKEVQVLVRDEWDVRFPKRYEVNGKWSLASIKKGVESLLANQDVQIVLALGMIASDVICHRPNLSKPVIGSFVFDQNVQNIPFKNGTSGVKNLSYIVSTKNFARSLEVFHQVVPFKNLAVLVDSLIPAAIPSLAKFAKATQKSVGYHIRFIPVESSVSAIGNAIPPDVDAILLTPLLKLTKTDIKQLAAVLIEKRLPSFSIFGREEVDQGIMMSIAPSTDYFRVARRIALILQKVLMGEEAGGQNVFLNEGEQLVMNMATTRLLKVRPTWEILADAELIQEEKPAQVKKLTLSDAVQEAMHRNYDVLIAMQEAKTSEEDKNKARANLLPRLEAEYDYKQVDKVQARQSFGTVPERENSGHLTLTQAVFSESAWSNWSTQKRVQKEKQLAVRNTALDSGLEAARAYLRALKAKTFEQVRKSDLKLTRSNLERAKARQLIGVANTYEVYRWDTQIATKKKDYLTSQSETQQAFIALNKSLALPQTTGLDLQETSLSDSKLLISDKRLDPYLKDPWSAAIFDEFVVEEGLMNAVELKRLHELIAAQKRQLDSAVRAHYLPSLYFQAKRDIIFARKGVGSDLMDKEKNSWSLGLTATLPLITGGAQIAEVVKAREELTRLELENERTKTKVEQRIRNALHAVNASYAGIDLAQQSLAAAHKTLDFITDSYTRGSVAIIDLIDAQNSAFASEQSAANAAYDFLLDLMEVERSVGQFGFFLTEAQRETFFKRLEAYFETHDKEAAS